MIFSVLANEKMFIPRSEFKRYVSSPKWAACLPRVLVSKKKRNIVLIVGPLS